MGVAAAAKRTKEPPSGGSDGEAAFLCRSAGAGLDCEVVAASFCGKRADPAAPGERVRSCRHLPRIDGARRAARLRDEQPRVRGCCDVEGDCHRLACTCVSWFGSDACE